MLMRSPKYLAELRGPKARVQQPENAYGESERLGLVDAMSREITVSAVYTHVGLVIKMVGLPGVPFTDMG